MASSSSSRPSEERFERPSRTPTDSSYYSCPGLDHDDPVRYLKASEVRRQVQAAPAKRQRIPAETSPRGKLGKYPTTFVNREKFELSSKSPWQEYPVLPHGNWDPTLPNTAEKARVVYRNTDRQTFDVVYHDPAPGKKMDENFMMANYRPGAGDRK